MGCDIHLHIEIEIDNSGVWEHWNAPRIERNYPLFALMADVRNGGFIQPISYPKGFPADATGLTELDYNSWSADAHSASWLDADEISDLATRIRDIPGFKRACLEYDILRCYMFGELFAVPQPILGTPHIVTDVRFVFWFDN